MKYFSKDLKLYLAQYREMLDFIKFGSEIDAETAKILHRGERLVEVLRQPVNTPRIPEFQLFMVSFCDLGYFDEVSMDEMPYLVNLVVEMVEHFLSDPVFKKFARYFRYFKGNEIKKIVSIFFKYYVTYKYKINFNDFEIDKKNI